MDEVIEAATGIKTKIAENPLECAAFGAYAALKEPTVFRRSETARLHR